MTKTEEKKFYQLLLDVQEQMHGGFHDLKIVIHGLSNRMDGFETRMDGFDKQLDAIRETQLEDSKALSSIVISHEKRLTKLENWRVKTAAV